MLLGANFENTLWVKVRTLWRNRLRSADFGKIFHRNCCFLCFLVRTLGTNCGSFSAWSGQSALLPNALLPIKVRLSRKRSQAFTKLKSGFPEKEVKLSQSWSQVFPKFAPSWVALGYLVRISGTNLWKKMRKRCTLVMTKTEKLEKAWQNGSIFSALPVEFWTHWFSSKQLVLSNWQTQRVESAFPTRSICLSHVWELASPHVAWNNYRF